MKLLEATFVFAEYRVTFAGERIKVERDAGDSCGWILEIEIVNRWVAQGQQNDGVMGRVWKPRKQDAETILQRWLSSAKSGLTVQARNKLMHS